MQKNNLPHLKALKNHNNNNQQIKAKINEIGKNVKNNSTTQGRTQQQLKITKMKC